LEGQHGRVKKVTMVKQIFLAFCLLFCVGSVFAQEMRLVVRSVHDGDTINVTLDSLPVPLNHASIRLRGIDTPEMGSRAKCEFERLLANLAKAYLASMVKPGDIITVTNLDWDKYGGRILGEVTDKSGRNVNALMILNKHAEPYSGEGAKFNWCGV